MRSSRSRKRWDGLLVCEADWEPQHPQDFVRGVKDRQNVEEPSPESVDTIIGPLTTTTTAAINAGATTLFVASSTRFSAADVIGVTRSDGDVQRCVVSSVPISTQIVVTAGTAMRGAVSSGALIVNYSAVSGPSY